MGCIHSERNRIESELTDGSELFSDFPHMQLLHIGLPSLLNRFLDILVDLINKVVLRFDALDYPFVHLVGQGDVVAALFQQPFSNFVANVFLLSA